MEVRKEGVGLKMKGEWKGEVRKEDNRRNCKSAEKKNGGGEEGCRDKREKKK